MSQRSRVVVILSVVLLAGLLVADLWPGTEPPAVGQDAASIPPARGPVGVQDDTTTSEHRGEVVPVHPLEVPSNSDEDATVVGATRGLDRLGKGFTVRCSAPELSGERYFASDSGPTTPVVAVRRGVVQARVYRPDGEAGIWGGMHYVGRLAWGGDGEPCQFLPVELTEVHGKLVDRDGLPVSGGRVRGCLRDAWVDTNSDGHFAMMVPKSRICSAVYAEVGTDGSVTTGGGRCREPGNEVQDGCFQVVQIARTVTMEEAAEEARRLGEQGLEQARAELKFRKRVLEVAKKGATAEESALVDEVYSPVIDSISHRQEIFADMVEGDDETAAELGVAFLVRQTEFY